MANALVVHKDGLPWSQMALRAAQYVRMSTDYQRYSIENQAAAIAAYAQLHQLSIVRTYRDEGESGLKFKNRNGLTQLLEDVRSGKADFGHVLVFDISRWGRFQDVDESAHYEFICKQRGIRVCYCAEDFDNDGSLISSIVKNIKRVMAAEYSRELSAKVHVGQLRLAKLGFKMGGSVGYGLQRLVVDDKCRPKAVLADGERKFLTTDHVRVLPGSPDERAVIKWIFEEFLQGKSQADIWRELNVRGVPAKNGQPWKYQVISSMLRNETYIGNLVYNRYSQKLGTKLIKNPEDRWIRSEGSVEPIIDRDQFLRARKRLLEYRVTVPEGEMLARLRKVLIKKRRLTAEIINATPGLPCSGTYVRRFGSLRNVYRLIGYKNTKYWEDLKSYQRWADLNRSNAALLHEVFQKEGAQVTFDPSTFCLSVKDAVNICFGLAKWRKYEGRPVRWTLYLRARQPMGWIVAIRLGENNQTVLDHLLLPSPSVASDMLWFSEKGRPVHKIERFETFEELERSLIKRVSRSPCSAAINQKLSKTFVLGSRKRVRDQ
jgi:DNA invertase Pin-like site-specific DNA recombinase